MNIKFSPVNNYTEKLESLTVSGNILILNDEEIILSELINTREESEGSLLNEKFNKWVESCDSDLNVTIKLPYGMNATEAAKFPNDPTKNPNAPYNDVPDGPILIPNHSEPRVMPELKKAQTEPPEQPPEQQPE